MLSSTRSTRSPLAAAALLVVLVAVAGGVLGALYGFASTQTQQATASVLVQPLEGNPFYPSGRGDDLTNLLSEAQVVSSDPVAIAVATAEGGSTDPARIRSGLSVTVPPNTQIIQISYAAPSETTAVNRAQDFAEAYLSYRVERAQNLVDLRSDEIDAQLAQRGQELQHFVKARTKAGTSARRALLDQQIQSVTGQLAVLRTQQAELLTGALFPGDITRPATSTGASTLSSTATYGLAGLAAGAVLGLGIAVLRARGRGTVDDPDDLAGLGVPVIGALTQSEISQVHDSFRVGGTRDLILGESFNALRASLLHAQPKRPSLILLSSTGDSEAAPASALGLATTLAAAGIRVVLVDATGSGEGLTNDLGYQDNPGLTEILQEGREVPRLFESGAHLAILSSGHATPRIDDLIMSSRMSGVLADLRRRADIVLVATGSVERSRAQTLALLTDSVLLEVREGHTTMSQVQSVSSGPSAIASKVIGCTYVARGSRLRGRGRHHNDPASTGPVAVVARDEASSRDRDV